MRARLVLIPMAIAVALVAGCTTNTPAPDPTPAPLDNGVSVLPVVEIVDKAMAALIATTSVRVKVSSMSDGKMLTVDVRLGEKDFAGTLDVDGTTIEISRFGDDLYVEAVEDFWKQFLPDGDEAALHLNKGKYMKVSTTNPQFAGIARLMDRRELLATGRTVAKGDTKIINGTPAIGLIDGDNNSIIYIATVGEPVPLRIERFAGEVIDFTEYGATLDLKPPDSAEVFD